MKTLRTHHLQIAGHPLTVRSSATVEYVEGLAAQIEARTRTALDQGAGPVAAALLAALALADELHRTQEELATLKGAVTDRVTALRSTIT